MRKNLDRGYPKSNTQCLTVPLEGQCALDLEQLNRARVAGAAGREIEEPSPLLQVRTDAPASFVPEEVSEERGGFRGIVFTYIRQLELNGKGVVVFDRLNKDGDLGRDMVSVY